MKIKEEKNMLTIIIGESGCGKDSIRNALVETEGFQRLTTTTSRPKREGEVDGIHYDFISKEEFEAGLEQGKFFEYRSYKTTANGVPITAYFGSYKKDLDENKDYVIVLDPQGAKTFVEAYGRENCFVVKVSVPESVRYQRAYDREFPKGFLYSSVDVEIRRNEEATFDNEWQNRINDDAVRFAQDKLDSVVNCYLNNNHTLATAIEDLKGSLESYKKESRVAGKQYIVEIIKSRGDASNRFSSPYSFSENIDAVAPIYVVWGKEHLDCLKAVEQKSFNSPACLNSKD